MFAMASRTTFYGTMIALLALSSMSVNGFPATYVPPAEIEEQREVEEDDANAGTNGGSTTTTEGPTNWLDALFMPIVPEEQAESDTTAE